MKIKAWNNVWLIILTFVFIGSQVEKGQSAEPSAAPGERIISFPTDSSMGKLSVRDWGSTEPEDWNDLGEARGDVTVPAGKEVRLKVHLDYSGDFSPLGGLGASDLQELILDNTKVGDTELVHLEGLTSLKLLKVNKKPVTGKSHPFLGKPLGELKFTSTKGEQIDISQYKGKVVLVDFWAVWCGPCIGELPNVKRTYNKYHDDGFEIIGISLDRSREKLEKFIEENDMPWPQYFDGKGWDNEISTSFDIQSIPSTFLLDGQGIVRYANLRGSALDLAVAEALGNPSSSTGQITDAGLAHLKGLTSLETLHFDNTQVGNDGLAHLKDLTSLKALYLGGTEVTDAGLAHLRNLGTLEQLCVHNTKITNAGLAHLKDLTGLEYLCIHNTFVSDAGLAYLKGLTSLKTLYLHNTQVTDTGLDHLKGLIRLEKLNLRGTKVSSVGLADLKQALPNCVVSGPSTTEGRSAPKSRLAKPGAKFLPEDIPLHFRILIAAIAIPIVSFLVAVFLKIFTRWAVKFNIPYWTAYKIEIIAAVIGFVIRVPFGVPGILWALLLCFVVHLLVNPIIYGQMIKHPDTNESIGYGKGLLIWFYLLLIWIPLALVLGCALGFAFVVFRFIGR